MPTTKGLGKRYGTFSGWGMAAGKVEVLLVVGGFDVDGGAKGRLVNNDVNIKEGDMGRGDGPGKTIPSELLRRGVREVKSVEGVKSILTMG